jgi:hypothetical protein
MSTDTVVPFRGKRSRNRRPLLDGAEGGVVWPVAELPDERQCGEWLTHVIGGTAYERTVQSLWQHQPNLRLATDKLAGFITPKWPAAAGGTLLAVAVERAATRAEELIPQGQAFEGAVVAAYLEGLLEVVAQIGQLVVRGQDRKGQIQRWEYFSKPLLQWARGHGIDRLLVHASMVPPTKLVNEGLRTHMIAAITTPVEAGYLAKYANRF